MACSLGNAFSHVFYNTCVQEIVEPLNGNSEGRKPCKEKTCRKRGRKISLQGVVVMLSVKLLFIFICSCCILYHTRIMMTSTVFTFIATYGCKKNGSK